MKYYILVVFLIGCGGSSEVYEPIVDPVNEPPIVWINTAIYPLINGGDTEHEFNASVEELNPNSWEFISNTNDYCINKTHLWNCKRGDVHIKEIEPHKTIMYQFDFTVYEYPFINSPYWMIVLQSRREGNDYLFGRHPITTLKLKNYNGHLYFGHYDNAWEFEEDAFKNNPYDTVHSIPDYERDCNTVIEIDPEAVNHQENRCNGAVRIELSATYKIQLIVSPNHASLIIDDEVISYEEYQTYGDIGFSDIKVGMYWTKEYNPTNDPLYRTIYRIDNFKRWVLIR